jgi:hypothetical protein
MLGWSLFSLFFNSLPSCSWVKARHFWRLRMRGLLDTSGAPQHQLALLHDPPTTSTSLSSTTHTTTSSSSNSSSSRGVGGGLRRGSGLGADEAEGAEAGGMMADGLRTGQAVSKCVSPGFMVYSYSMAVI